MAGIDMERIAQWDTTNLRETEQGLLDHIKRDKEAKKAEILKAAKKKKRKRSKAARAN